MAHPTIDSLPLAKNSIRSGQVLPPNNYLWISPYGAAYPGWLHQMVLHLLAQSDMWYKQELDLSSIKALFTNLPDHTMDVLSLRSIGAEYLDLNLETRMAYRELELPIFKKLDQIPMATIKNPDWDPSLDPALFIQSDSSSTVQLPITSSPFSNSTAATLYSNCELSHHSIVKGLDQGRFPSITHSALGSKSTTPTDRGRVYISSPQTPAQTIPLFTPARPRPDRFIDRQELSRSTSPTPQPIDNPQSMDKEIHCTLYFKSKHNFRQSHTSEQKRPTEMTNLTTIEANGIDTSQMRLPDPSKYIQTSKRHFTIPASEAAAFIHWFNPKVDYLPDKIEGYIWYCDDCYVGENPPGNTSNIRGKFVQKLSVERHHELVHQKVWEHVLPERDRTMMEGSEAAVQEIED